MKTPQEKSRDIAVRCPGRPYGRLPQFSFRFAPLLLLICVVLLAACGGDDHTPAVELDRRVSLVEGFVKLQLPETWLADEDGRSVVLFASHQDALTRLVDDWQTLDAVVADLPPDSQVGVILLSQGTLGNYTPGSVLEDQFSVEGSPFPPGLIRETRLNGRNSAIAPIEFADATLGGMLGVVDWQGEVVTLIGVWTSGSDPNIADTYEAILAQLEIDVGGLTQQE